MGDASQLRRDLWQVSRQHSFCDAEVQRERDEPLLNSVVQVALDQTPCLVAGGHDPGTRGGERFAALLQGTCHRVEAAFEYTDLAGASVGSARAEVSAGEPARHDR